VREEEQSSREAVLRVEQAFLYSLAQHEDALYEALHGVVSVAEAASDVLERGAVVLLGAVPLRSEASLRIRVPLVGSVDMLEPELPRLFAVLQLDDVNRFEGGFRLLRDCGDDDPDRFRKCGIAKQLDGRYAPISLYDDLLPILLDHEERL